MKDNFAVDSIQINLNPGWNITETRSPKHKAFGYRFWPDKLNGEGFFIAAFRKDTGQQQYMRQQKLSLQKVSSREVSIAENYLESGNDWLLFSQNENIHAIKTEWSN